MRNDGTRWVEGAVLGLAIVAVGCSDPKPGDDNADETGGTEGDGDGDTGQVPDNGIPLELELARFDKTGKFLLLRFSEAMAPVDGVDPGDFRLSLAITVRYHYYGSIESSSFYWDPLWYLGYYDYYGSQSSLVADLIANGNQATDIVLRFADPMTADACAQYTVMQADVADLDESPEYEAKIGLFPHYSPGAAAIRSADGESLAAIGPEWVELDAPYMDLYEQFGWPNLDPQVEIPCDITTEP